MGRRGYGVRAFGNHPGPRHIAHDFRARQVSPDSRLGALAHLDLNGNAGLEIPLVHAEAPGGDLHHRVRTVAIQVLMQPAFSGVIKDSQLFGRPRQRFVGVVADGAIAHSRKHHRHGKRHVRGHFAYNPTLIVALYGTRRTPQRHARLHGFAQRIDGRIGDLRGVNQELVPIHRLRSGRAHGGKKHTACRRLFVRLLHQGRRPVGTARAQAFGSPIDSQCVLGAESRASLAVHAQPLVAFHRRALLGKTMNPVCALLLAYATVRAARFVANHLEERIRVINSHRGSPFEP